MVKRRMCLRNLGRIYLDERKSLTELRAILRKLLEEALRKATQQVTLDAVRATEAAAQAARAAQAENVKALGPTAGENDYFGGGLCEVLGVVHAYVRILHALFGETPLVFLGETLWSVDTGYVFTSSATSRIPSTKKYGQGCRAKVCSQVRCNYFPPSLLVGVAHRT